MLEGAVARILNQILGKYVVDLDTENLNVGIFSGKVQLTDLKLKPEALYELNLPIEVKAGTIGKVWLQIPWNTLWTHPVVATIEDVHVVAAPIVSRRKFDPETNKRLLRAAKKKILTDLKKRADLIGGPTFFPEYLATNVVNNLQLNVSNVHIRYEDDVGARFPLACGVCVGNVTAEITNGKWKPVKMFRPADNSFYLVKVEAFSVYWNPNHKSNEWKLPSQYYQWRNSMSDSLRNFAMNGQDFEFLVKPMTGKVKLTISKNHNQTMVKLHADVVVQDCNLQVSREQFTSIVSAVDSLRRMSVSRNFLMFRPQTKLSEDPRSWWVYAFKAVSEQRIKPYTFKRIQEVRENYRRYYEIYKRLLINPNDTELKLDLQKYEDQLSIVNIVIARQQARLSTHESSLCEKSFWDILPSPERTVLCEKIGFSLASDNEKRSIDHNYSFRIGNIGLSLVHDDREVLVMTVTQFISNVIPNYSRNTYKLSVKTESIVVEGASVEDHLLPILSSEHINVHNSPAYFFKFDLEKCPPGSASQYKLNCVLEYLEISYHKYAFDELKKFFDETSKFYKSVIDVGKNLPSILFEDSKSKILNKWDMKLDLKLPYFVIPEGASLQTGENILIVDFGQFKMSTELSQDHDISEHLTSMELEEKIYSRMHLKLHDIQMLFCDNTEDWRAGRKERDTELHVLAKSSVSAVYSICTRKNIEKIPKQKISLNFPHIKLNVSERKMSTFLKFLTSLITIESEPETKEIPIESKKWESDRIIEYNSRKYLLHVQNYITLHSYVLCKRKSDKTAKPPEKKKRSIITFPQNMNEVWARCVDLPGLEDNVSPNNKIISLIGCSIAEFQLLFSKSSDSTDRQYLVLRLGEITIDAALMTYGPAYQISLNSVLITDKLHTASSGQYLDLMYSPVPSDVDVLVVLYRRVGAGCPDFWTHFHGVETSLVADVGELCVLLHQEAVHTFIKYTKYMKSKIENQISPNLSKTIFKTFSKLKKLLTPKVPETPVPPGSIKFSHSARFANLNVRVCDSDYDIINVQTSNLELDFLFRANERFVFRSYLGNISVDHLSDVTLYNKVLSTDEDKVFEIKYVRHATHLVPRNDISPLSSFDNYPNGTFKLHMGQIHVTFLYKLFVQLQRFVINLEALCYIETAIEFVHKAIEKATDTLKNNSKINLAINLKGPILLFPQKSSSPNVIVINTGEFDVENFFKDYTSEIVENVLVKINGVTVNRGIMTLTSTLEMQEVIVEPVNLSVDVKRFSPCSNSTIKNQCWDVDGIMDSIRITLGQRDLATILAIYADNIGEGKLLDLFPVPTMKSPTGGLRESDRTVRTLEAFFSIEPKQKCISTRVTFDGISVLLFFDSGELLSSPIRDLNHGLCKFEVIDVTACCVLYTDNSIDGKLSVDGVCIEEIGPDVNVYDKGILQSPADDNKNNNCNITVNKPPIIDLTFHQTKNDDRAIDIIIGRLCLSLSVPFTEKMAMFAVDCLPKDTLDMGIINHGYINDPITDEEVEKTVPKALTVAVRINRPEFVFVVETTSNKRRYFVTKTEILSDYSRHGSLLSLVVSLSGLHSCFYDIGIHTMEPYCILKQCDVELSRNFSEEKGTKIILMVSSIHIQLCNRVVYAVHDILNDIIEHFKLPEEAKENLKLKRIESKEKEDKIDDLWEPKHLPEHICREVPIEKPVIKLYRELFLIPKTEIILTLELEEIPVILFKTGCEFSIYDWSSLLNATLEFMFQANYFNDTTQSWEPILDPVVTDDYEYKPFDIIVKVFQDKALPMIETKPKNKSSTSKNDKKSLSSSDEESGEDMVYIEPSNSFHTRSNRKVKTSLSTFLDDSDSENEDGTMEKLAAAISDLFTGDWNESEASESDHSSEGDEDSEEEVKPKHPDAYPNKNYKRSIYALIDCKEILDFSITPSFLKTLNELFTVYSNKTLSIYYDKSISITNDIGPMTKLELFENKGTKSVEDSTLVCSKTYETQDSNPNSPSRNFYYDDFDDRDSYTDETNKDIEFNIDLEPISSLDFPLTSTATLYEQINKHHLKIHVPGFPPVQTCCPKKSWEKLIRLYSIAANKTYYLLAKHEVNKHGRRVVVSSPLQIRNETCFALSVLYQPSVLQQMNLEPVGDVTNPFETTMRIAVLEPHEQYNVPLYIAYHCKLFIQPAYAEGHYHSDTGIWWQDLATDLDTAHNFHCTPKTGSNLEIFSLRVVLKRHFNNPKKASSQLSLIPNYIIHLLPPLVVFNYLPHFLEVENIDLKQHLKVEPGEKASAYSLNLSKDQKLMIRVISNSSTWSGMLNLTPHLDEKMLNLLLEGKDEVEGNKNLVIHIKTDREGSVKLFFYSPYWIVNKTNLPIFVKASSSNLVYESIKEDILLFSYKRHGKQSLNLKVFESDWSNDFGIECSGTTGLIVCKDNQRKKKYSILMNIKLSEICSKHTRIVTFLPNFLIINNTAKLLRFMEDNEKTDLWIDLQPKQCVPFWPETNSMQMFVKYRDSKLKSHAFYIATTHRTVLRMDKGTAICVEVSGGKTESFMVTFNEYKDGDAPCYIKNYCADLFLKIQQQNQKQVTLLNPYHSMVYTWDDPTKPRVLLWNVYNNRGVGFNIDVSKDSHGDEKISFHSVTYQNPNQNQNQTQKDETSSSDDSDSCDSVKTTLNKKVRKDKLEIYYVCYREGLKRILIFTQEEKVYEDFLRLAYVELCDFECFLSVTGLGISLFTSKNLKKEHLYFSIADTPPIWEVNVGHKWKTLTLELASWIEDKYRLPYKKCQLKDYVHIDFEKMFMLKPFFAELRRTYNSALYLHFRKSQNYQFISMKVQTIQIDNKQPTSSDPLTLSPMPREAIKANPVINFSLFRNSSKSVCVYKNVELIMEDFYVNLEAELIEELSNMLMEFGKVNYDPVVAFRSDLSSIRLPLHMANKDRKADNCLVENLNVSQATIKLNISQKTYNNNNFDGCPYTRILDFIFPPNLSPYMPSEGIRHKISSFELKEKRTDFRGILTEIWNHFSTQFLEQYYSQVLGQHVLVNPYAIQAISPNEGFSEEFDKTSSTIFYGCRCCLGHINMSLAAIEQCIVDIFANQTLESLQRYRRHSAIQRPCLVPSCVTASTKCFNPGVIMALEQIIVRNQTGFLQCEGEFFFKGTGKALHSLITRHQDDRSSCLQLAIEALRRAASLGEPVKVHQRLARYYNLHLGLKPYSPFESMGNRLLETVCNNRFANDTYWAHCGLDSNGRTMFIVTLERLIRVSKCRTWGGWELEWVLDLDEVVSVPKLEGNELVFNVRKGEVTFENSSSDDKLSLIGDKELLAWIQEKIEQAIVVSMEEKSWAVTGDN